MLTKALRGPTIGLALCLATLLATPATAQLARSGPPSCAGRNLLPEIKAESAEARRRLEAAAAASVNARSIFWRLEKAGLPPSYIMGTVHLTDDRVNALTPAMQAAIGRARVMALEIADLSPAALNQGVAKVASLLQMPGGRSLEALLDPAEIEIARQALKANGIPPEALPTLRPWVVSMSMALTECERRRTAGGLKPLDERIGDQGRGRGITVISLETIEEQLRALAAVPEADQLSLLKAGLKLHHLTADMIETLVLRYLAGDISEVWPMQVELWRRHGVGEAAVAAFHRELVAIRNRRMVEAAMTHLDKGGVFIAVGALHLPGTDGMVALIKDKGFTVVPVP